MKKISPPATFLHNRETTHPIYQSLGIRQNINHKQLQLAANSGLYMDIFTDYALWVIQSAKIKRGRRTII